jgi:serine/threonine-protein kinase
MSRTITVAVSAGAAAARTLPPPAPSDRLGRWELVRRLAAGTMGTVYRARPVDGPQSPIGPSQPRAPADYAIKLLHRHWEDVPEALACFRREVQAGRTVQHPHVVQVLAAQVDRPPYFLVMPQLAGCTLAEQLASGRRSSLAEALWQARQAAQALTALHTAGWLHGDVNPSNLMLSPNGHVTLIDLGFAHRLAEEQSAHQRPVQGTLNYLAPELTTSVWRAGPQSDLYSLGAVLYEVLTGRPPFAARTLAELVSQHRQQRPPRLRTLAPHAPRELERLVARLLAKDPMRRPESAAEVVWQLARMEVASFAAREAPAAVPAAEPPKIAARTPSPAALPLVAALKAWDAAHAE